MRFRINLTGKTIYNMMRECGYTPERFDDQTDEFRFHRSITGRPYPKFHIYCTVFNGTASLNLHLDQKQPSYKGTHAHSGEYDGELIENENARIQQITAK